MKVIIAGAGVGSEKMFTGDFIEVLKGADLVLTSERLLDSLSKINENVEVMGVLDTVKYINERADQNLNVVVAASGDTGFYSIAKTVSRMVDSKIEIEYRAGIGSLAYFASKIQIGYENMKLISLHGKEKSIVPYVNYNQYVFSLSGGTLKAHNIINELCEKGLGRVTVYVGENLSDETEIIVIGSAEELKDKIFGDLAVLVIENDNFTNSYKSLRDEDFIRGKSPMTKQAIRNLSVAALEIKPQDVVYDIGAGTGSVTCAMALKANESMVYAIEKEQAALELLENNMDKLDIRNITYVSGLAPEGMESFPPADKVFIGGSSGNLRDIVNTVLAKNDKAMFVVTAVSLETLNEAVSLFNDGTYDTEISSVSVANAKKLGRYNLMMGENPVYIIKGVKKID